MDKANENPVGDTIEALRAAAASHAADGILGLHGRAEEYKAAHVRDAEAFTRAGFTPGMTFEEFSASVLRFESLVNAPRHPIERLPETLRLFWLAAELLDMIKKSAFYGRAIDHDAQMALRNEAWHAARDLLGSQRPSPVISIAPTLIPSGAVPNMRALHALLGYCTEAGEVAGALRTALMSGEPVDRVNVDEEFADGDWYKAVWFDVTAQTQGATLRKVADKLTLRYGNKPYADKAALERDLPAERSALEARAAKGFKDADEV